MRHHFGKCGIRGFNNHKLPKLPLGGSYDEKSVMEVGTKTLIDENDGFWDIYPKDEEWTRVLKKNHNKGGPIWKK